MPGILVAHVYKRAGKCGYVGEISRRVTHTTYERTHYGIPKIHDV